MGRDDFPGKNKGKNYSLTVYLFPGSPYIKIIIFVKNNSK